MFVEGLEQLLHATRRKNRPRPEVAGSAKWLTTRLGLTGKNRKPKINSPQTLVSILNEPENLAKAYALVTTIQERRCGM